MFGFAVLLLATGALGLTTPLNKSRIIGGSYASEGQYPYQVTVKLYEVHHCGGSIINEKSILSAAHCYSANAASSFTVTVGTVLLSNFDADTYKVSQIRLHEFFNPHAFKDDVAIIKLRDSIVYNWKVKPIALETRFIEPMIYAVTTGWGVSYPGVYPDQLKRIDILTMDNKQCGQQIQTIYESHLCTFISFGQGVCSGDSGGPLVIDSKQVGITSFGRACAMGFPDVFTRVSSYLRWINIHSQ